MRKLSEIVGEDALDILADLIEPFMAIAQDKQFVLYVRSRQTVKAAKLCIKNHKKEILMILALLEGEDPSTYKPPLLRLPKLIVELLNDPELVSLFPSLQTEMSSGSATENTEGTGEG